MLRSPVATPLRCLSTRRVARVRPAATPSQHDLRELALAASDSAVTSPELLKLAAAEARFAVASAAVMEYAAEAREVEADPEVVAAQAELSAALAELRRAGEARDAAAAAAGEGKWAPGTAVDDDAERLESGKAAAVGGGAAAAAAAPLALGMAGGLAPLSLASAAAAGALFAVVYRYASRKDANSHLKGGVVAAFGLVRGGAQVEALASASEGRWAELLSTEVLAKAAALVGESVLLFALAAAALEVGLSHGWLSTFPSGRKS